MCPDIPGYLSIPYPLIDRVVRIPAFITKIRDDMGTGTETRLLVPTFMTRLIKHFQRDEQFNFSIFLLSKGTCLALSWLPIIAQLGLFIIYLTIPQYTSKSGYQALRDEQYLQFFIARRISITQVPSLNELYERICYVSRTFTVPRLSKDESRMITMFKTGPPQMVFNTEYAAIALFLTEIITAKTHWDVICSEWGVYRNSYASFLQNLDLLIGMIDNPYLPIAQLQIDTFKAAIYNCPKVDCHRFSMIANDPHAMKLSFGQERQDIVCGMLMKEYPIGPSPCILAESRENFQCLENHLLIVVTSCILYIRKVFIINEQFSFRERRQQYTSTITEIIPQFLRHDIQLTNETSQREARLMAFDQYGRILYMSKTPREEITEALVAGLNASLN
jgi:hypothetical protein